MANYLWKKLSDSERKAIEKEAKNLILEFGDRLEKLPNLPESSVERDDDMRVEGKPNEGSKEFRELMFNNAPNKKDDCIVAEKGKWTE